MWTWDCSALRNLAISKHLTYMNERQRLIENWYRTELGNKTHYFEAAYVDLWLHCLVALVHKQIVALHEWKAKIIKNWHQANFGGTKLTILRLHMWICDCSACRPLWNLARCILILDYINWIFAPAHCERQAHRDQRAERKWFWYFTVCMARINVSSSVRSTSGRRKISNFTERPVFTRPYSSKWGLCHQLVSSSGQYDNEMLAVVIN